MKTNSPLSLRAGSNAGVFVAIFRNGIIHESRGALRGGLRLDRSTTCERYVIFRPSRKQQKIPKVTSISGWWFGCHQSYFPRNIGLLSSSQLTNSYFSEGWPNHQPDSNYPESSDIQLFLLFFFGGLRDYYK